MTTETTEKKQRKNLTDIGVGVILALCVYFFVSSIWNHYNSWQSQAPATNWVEVSSFTVPNFQPGADPVIDYVRNVKQTVSSSWTTEVRIYSAETDNYEIACSKSGFNELEPGRPNPVAGWKLSSFIGDECVSNLVPGRYRLFVTWNLDPVGIDRTIVYPFSSNTFFVGEVS